MKNHLFTVLIVTFLLSFSIACEIGGDDSDNNSDDNIIIMAEDTTKIIVYNGSDIKCNSFDNGAVIPVPEGAVAGILSAKVENDTNSLYPVYIGYSSSDALYYEISAYEWDPDPQGISPAEQSIFLHSLKKTELRVWVWDGYWAANGINPDSLNITLTPKIWYME